MHSWGFWPTNTPFWNKWGAIYRHKENFKGSPGPEAALQFYLENKAVMDEGAQILWPERWDLYKLMQMFEENEYSFRSEMQNSPLDISQMVFKVDEFHYWNERYSCVEDLLRDLGRNAEFYGACDPSLGANPQRGDYSAIIVLARDKRGRENGLYLPTEPINNTGPKPKRLQSL